MAKSNAKAQSEQLFNLQVQGDKYARLLVAEKQRYRQLDAQWRKVYDELKQLRQQRSQGDLRNGGANAVKAKLADEQREMMKLENRLSACRTRESKMISYNNELREKVDRLRANRLLSQSIFEKNQRKLREIQREMQEVFRVSTQLMTERDRIVAQAHDLSTTNMDEQENFDHVFQNLATIIRRERENAESYRKQVLETDPVDFFNDFTRGNYKIEEEQQLKKTLERLDSSLQEDQAMIETINEKLEEFGSTFSMLQKQLNVEDYHDIVKVYLKKEEENFALFRYVQSLNNEIEQLEEEKGRVDDEKLKLSNEMKEGSAHMRKRLMEDLVEARQKILKESAEYERLRANAAREFQPLARSVDRLYNALGCNEIMTSNNSTSSSSQPNNNDSSGKLGRKQSEDQNTRMARVNSMNDILAAHGVTEGNILQFLAIIEQRSNELIEQFSRRLQLKNPNETSRASLGAHLKPSDPTRPIQAVRALLPEYAAASSNGTSASSNAAVSIPVSGMTTNLLYTTMEEENLTPTGGSPTTTLEEDECDRVMTRAELQKKAAKSLAALQVNPKFQLTNVLGTRPKPVANKKKK